MVREDWTFQDLLAAGWSEADLEWERLAEAAFTALAAGKNDVVGSEIAAALRLARAEFAANDPRLAASLSNQAAIVATDGNGGAERIRAAAVQAWAACDGWIEAMTAPRTARSSMFHLRMERLHRPAYEERWRVRGRELLATLREEIHADAPLALIAPEEAASRLARWHRERPVTLSDPRKLMAAVILLAAREKGAPDAARHVPEAERQLHR
ncbi:hypothetical protein [Manganibacter manganicus]|uniref:Uncharacterized protein n=1 Tax=Manganibacter manganicus TaxID=1873176 RepID=A0A1V8RLV8_9HYPH|nr:hypothetical protein [Pseudaminobacter manganicus]OQM74191.1 hypothetical protein BFN67_04875 [Pseudaminobacter manganicus]